MGDEAENLVYKFCSVDRQTLEATVLADGTIRPGGYEMAHIVTGAPLSLSGREAAAMICETLADEAEQRFGWQSDLEAGDVLAPWPGRFQPTLRLARTSRLAAALRASELVAPDALPPIFERCSATLDEADERRARALYMEAVLMPALQYPLPPLANEPIDTSTSSIASSTFRKDLEQLERLRTIQRLNPFVAEPHLVEAQVHLHLSTYAHETSLYMAKNEPNFREECWRDAEAAAVRGVALLETNATSWDKRMSWAAWLNWGRCLGFQAQRKEWPTTHGGIESLGAVVPRQRTRALNVGRSMV